MNKSLVKTTTAFGIALFALAAHADHNHHGTGMDMDHMKMESAEKGSPGAMSINEGEVKAVDKARKKITLKHGPIKSKTVEMGSMTMSFPVESSSLLSSVKVGDKVIFNVENVKNTATVTSLQVQD